MKEKSSNQKTSQQSKSPAAGMDGVAMAASVYGLDTLHGSTQTIQQKADPSSAGGDAAGGSSPNRTGLPDDLKAGVESLSGLSMDDVRVHPNSSKPAQLQALAYTQGTDIHVGPGQERHLPHEAWHVVQQKQRRVKPTIQLKSGISVNDNIQLEQEADQMGAQAIQQSSMPTHLQNVALAPTASAHADVAQLKPEYKSITGITHLVEMTEDGSIYNEDYEENEFMEVQDGDIVQIEGDISFMSRRGPNQEVYSKEDESGDQVYQWYKVLKVNRARVEQDVYVRADTFEPLSSEENLVQNMKDMQDMQKMQWNGSGAKEFSAWTNDERDEDPTEANCWNSILFAAYKAGLVDKAYIKRANEGGMTETGPMLAREIARNPAGRVMKADAPSTFKARVAEAALTIPVGNIIVLSKAGFHVCLSLGGGRVLELDNQGMKTLPNPFYNPKFQAENKKLSLQLLRFREKATRKAATPEDRETYTQKQKEYEDWQKTNSMKETITERKDNEMVEKNLTAMINYFDMVNMEGVYWGPLPDL